MTVAELIAELAKNPADRKVVIPGDGVTLTEVTEAFGTHVIPNDDFENADFGEGELLLAPSGELVGEPVVWVR